MNKLVALNISYLPEDGSYQVIAGIGDEGKSSEMEIKGYLPKLSDKFLKMIQDWEIVFRRLDAQKRLKVRKISADQFIKTNLDFLSPSSAKNINYSWDEICKKIAEKLGIEMNLWLNSDGFKEIKRNLAEKLTENLTNNIQIVICTSENIICRLPWTSWDILKINFDSTRLNTEICFDLTNKNNVDVQLREVNSLEGSKFLIVLGDDEGINLEKDQAILDENFLRKTDIFYKLLVKPDREEFEKELEFGAWDTLFFSGHSETLENEGVIYLKNGESVHLSDLSLSFKKAVSKGLKLAIFNSCDGIGIAKSLQKLQIPQIIVMREPISDRMAHDFLSAYIDSLKSLPYRDSPLYLAARYAREKLKNTIICADWLPLVFQNHKMVSPVRGFIERSKSTYNDIETLELKVHSSEEEPIYKDRKATVIDPISESSIGKIQYRGALWNARILPYNKYKVEGCEKITSIFPGDEISIISRKGNTYSVLPKELFEKWKTSANKNKKKKIKIKKKYVIITLSIISFLLGVSLNIFYSSTSSNKNGSHFKNNNYYYDFLD
jgi:hypothetical protein